MSKLGKTKTIQKGEIKPQNFTTQHKIAYESDELVTGLKDLAITNLASSQTGENKVPEKIKNCAVNSCKPTGQNL